MIGGLMKTTSRLTIATAFAAFATTGAMAADLGGNCCADLEERVAELEATTARKGNRVQSLTIYGQVAKGIVWHDDEDTDAANEVTLRDMNGRSGTRFGLKGSAKINSDLTAGFLIEIGVDNGQPINGAANPRYSQVILTSKRMGTVKIGQGSQATDGITEIKLGGALSGLFSAGESSDPSPTASAAHSNNWDGGRETGVVYNTPEIAGFVFYTGWYNGTNQNEVDTAISYDFALRYANEFNGVRIAAGVGYRVIDNRAATATTPAGDTEIFGASASILHVASGLFLNAAYGDTDNDTARHGGALGADNSGWGISGGIAKKWSPLGTTSIEVRYTQFDPASGRTPESYGFGISQNIDAAAMDVYLLWENYDTDAGGTADDVNVITLGTRVRF